MDDAILALKPTLLAALVAGCFVGLGARAWRSPERSGKGAAWATALGLALGYAAGHVLADKAPAFPPREATHRLFYLALAAGLIGVIGGGERVPGAARGLVRAVFSAAVPAWFLRTFFERWELERTLATVLGIAAGVFATWECLRFYGARRPGASLPAVVWTIATLGSAALLKSSNLTYALLAGCLAAMMGAALVVSWRAPRLDLGRGGAGVIATLLACLWMGGTFLSELPANAAVLLAIAPLAAWLGELRFVRARPPWQAVLARMLLVALPAGAALALAIANAPPPNPYY